MWQPRIRLWEGVLLLGLLLLATVVDSRATFSPLSRLTRTSNRAISLQPQQQFAVDLRGGATLAEEDSDSEDEEEEDSEDELSDDDEEEVFGTLEEEDFDTAESEFAEANWAERMLQDWKKTPPLTKGYLMASFAATGYGYVACKNEFPPLLSLEWKAVKSFQFWRPFTAFLNFGPFGLGYAMTAHFVWTYMSTLERLHHSNPYDFWIMMAFGVLSMVVGYPLLKMSPKFLGHNLSTFLVYIWARFHEGMEVNMFELFNTRAELLPWFFLAQTFLLEGELPTLDLLGIVFGHIYHHFKTVGLLKAPASLVTWYKSDSPFAKDLRSKYRVISEDFELLDGEG